MDPLSGILLGGGALLGGLAGGQKQKTSGSSTYTLPPPTAGQSFAENQLLNMLQGFNFGGQQQLAQTTTGQMQNLLGAGLAVTPAQQALIEGQTAQFMKGLEGTLGQWRKGAMSQAQQSGIARGIPLSDIARGQEANVDAQYLQQLAQGWNQAKMAELQAKLQYPLQNLSTMAGLQSQFNAPYINMLQQLAMSRYGMQPNVTQTQKGGGGLGGFLGGALGGLGTMGSLFGGGGMFGKGGAFGAGGAFGNTTASGWAMR